MCVERTVNFGREDRGNRTIGRQLTGNNWYGDERFMIINFVTPTVYFAPLAVYSLNDVNR